MDLQHSTVQRGGVTSRYWYGRTKSVSGDVVPSGLRFTFVLPSKGGGNTSIQLAVDIRDLRAILKELAVELPSLADTFAESTTLAVSKIMQAREQ